MPWYFILIFFVGSCCILSWLSSRLVRSLVSIARYLQWREFIIAFFVMAMAASLPDFLVSMSAAIQGKPLLALGNMIGGNLVDLTLVLAIAVFFSRKGFSAESSMVQSSAWFTVGIAIMPLLLLLDGRLSRIDGLMLICMFAVYSFWLFSNSRHFKKIYRGKQTAIVLNFKRFFIDLVKVILLLGLLLIASQAVVFSAEFFANTLGISLVLVGIVIVGLGNAFPDMYFSILAARREENWMVLGDVMGSVVTCATLVIGCVALLFPFSVGDIRPFLIASGMLVAAVVAMLVFIKTDRYFTKKEGLALLSLYIIFLIAEIFVS